MKSLAIDSASSCISIAAINGDKTARVTLNIGMHQSEKLLPTIEYVLTQCELKSDELEFTTICRGPGSFTGLRLGFAALKGLEMSNNCHIYGIPTLDVYAFQFAKWNGIVLSVLDAKKDCFYVSAYKNGTLLKGPLDAEPNQIIELISDDGKTSKDAILAVGPDAGYFSDIMKDLYPNLEINVFDCGTENKFGRGLPCVASSTDALFALASIARDTGKEPLAEYEGPIYIRKSEAEIQAEKKERDS